MSTTEVPSERTRDEAVKAVELACAEGQIIPADRDIRIQQIRQAHNQAEIDLALGTIRTRLQAPTPPEGSMVNLDAATGRTRPLPFLPLAGGVAAVMVGIAVVVFFVSSLSGVDLEPGPGSPTSPGGRDAEAEVLSVEGFAALVEAVRRETGDAKVFDATLYPTYAVLQLPVDRETRRQAYYYWDGEELESHDSFGRASAPRIDLATVSEQAMLRLIRQVRRLVEEPTSWYVIIRAADENDPSVIYAYASNKFTEGGYISATADGTVVRKVTW